MTVLGGQATGETPGNVALQVRITGPIHVTHPARTERFKDLVVTEALADQDDGSHQGKAHLAYSEEREAINDPQTRSRSRRHLVSCSGVSSSRVPQAVSFRRRRSSRGFISRYSSADSSGSKSSCSGGFFFCSVSIPSRNHARIRAIRSAGPPAARPPDAAGDVAQTVFLTFLNVVKRFEGRSHVRTLPVRHPLQEGRREATTASPRATHRLDRRRYGKPLQARRPLTHASASISGVARTAAATRSSYGRWGRLWRSSRARIPPLPLPWRASSTRFSRTTLPARIPRPPILEAAAEGSLTRTLEPECKKSHLSLTHCLESQ